MVNHNTEKSIDIEQKIIITIITIIIQIIGI